MKITGTARTTGGEAVQYGNVFISDQIGQPVMVNHNETVTTVGTMTDEDGAFTLDGAPENSRYVTLQWQFKKFTVPVRNGQAHFEVIIPDNEIPEVEVTAPRPVAQAAAAAPKWRRMALIGGLAAAVIVALAWIAGRSGRSGSTPTPRRSV